MKTTLQYLDAMETYEGEAVIIAIATEGDRLAVVLDQTIMYPQGGGQPCDVGSITAGEAHFVVADVRNIDGVVYHYGVYEHPGDQLLVGSAVTVTIDRERRQLHSRVHTAGHVIDMGLEALGITWQSGKGYHFPAGPYVEYIGQIELELVQTFYSALLNACSTIIAADYPCHISYDPTAYKGDVPLRLVTFGSLAIPCGGTHVSTLHQITGFTIRKIKQDGERIRISYQVAEV